MDLPGNKNQIIVILRHLNLGGVAFKPLQIFSFRKSRRMLSRKLESRCIIDQSGHACWVMVKQDQRENAAATVKVQNF